MLPARTRTAGKRGLFGCGITGQLRTPLQTSAWPGFDPLPFIRPYTYSPPWEEAPSVSAIGLDVDQRNPFARFPSVNSRTCFCGVWCSLACMGLKLSTNCDWLDLGNPQASCPLATTVARYLKVLRVHSGASLKGLSCTALIKARSCSFRCLELTYVGRSFLSP